MTTSPRRALIGSAPQGEESRPTVSVIVPCRNEERTIGALLEALAAQTYPVHLMEVVIADGASLDGTREVIDRFRAAHPRLDVSVIRNERRIIPAALNAAIAASGGEILVRMDAHSVPEPDYVERCVGLLLDGRGDNVGGGWEIRPSTPSPMSRAIAAAAAHPLGAGDARYRIGGPAGAVDTVPFGAFRREFLARVGPFAEDVPFDEDTEMNVRIRRLGGVVWFDPSIRSVYYARPTLRALARQYWRYGASKRLTLRRDPRATRWRQLVPAVFVASLGGLAILSPFSAGARKALAGELTVYTAAVGAGGCLTALRTGQRAVAALMPLAFAGMHLAYGLGFLFGGRSSRA